MSGEVRIEAWDDAGVMHGPVTLRLGGGEAAHFNSLDLEEGNEGKGLTGSTGAGTGQWRLALRSTLDLEVLSYIRTGDGFLTSMHDVAPEGAQGHRVVIFNPGRNANQASRLRVVNAGEEEAEVRIEGVDDAGESPGGAVTLHAGRGRLAHAERAGARERQRPGPGAARSGTGTGKWRLVVHSAAAAAGAEPAREPDRTPDEPVERGGGDRRRKARTRCPTSPPPRGGKARGCRALRGSSTARASPAR